MLGRAGPPDGVAKGGGRAGPPCTCAICACGFACVRVRVCVCVCVRNDEACSSQHRSQSDTISSSINPYSHTPSPQLLLNGNFNQFSPTCSTLSQVQALVPHT